MNNPFCRGKTGRSMDKQDNSIEGGNERSPVLGTVPWALGRLTSVLRRDLDAQVSAALEFAARAHAGQTRQVCHGLPLVPYFVHPVEVAVLAAEWSPDVPATLASTPILLAAALLHDTLEDCAVSVADIASQFGDAVLALVLTLTKPRVREKESSNERSKRFTQQIAMGGPTAVFLKLCDLLHNLAELETTPTDVLRRALEKGRTHYFPMVDQVPLGARFEAFVRESISRAEEQLSRLEPASCAEVSPARLHQLLAQTVTRKSEAHDAIQLLNEIAGIGQAAVVRFPRDGTPSVLANTLSIPLDTGRLEAIRNTVRQQGGVALLRPKLFKTSDKSANVKTAFACLDYGFDGADTILIWLLPEGSTMRLPEGLSLETILPLVLAAVMKPSGELHRDLAAEALHYGLQLDLTVASELGLQRGQLGQLVRWRHACTLACDIVEGEFRAFLHTRDSAELLWHRVRLEHRVKSCPSIMAKFRKNARLKWPEFDSLEDIAGVRVICPTAWHAEQLVNFLQESGAERPLSGNIKRFDREPTPQGYRGIHAIRSVHLPGVSMVVTCEVQIRTLIQDAWATLSHTVAYKTDRVNERRQRDALRVLSSSLAECEQAAKSIFDKSEIE